MRGLSVIIIDWANKLTNHKIKILKYISYLHLLMNLIKNLYELILSKIIRNGNQKFNNKKYNNFQYNKIKCCRCEGYKVKQFLT